MNELTFNPTAPDARPAATLTDFLQQCEARFSGPSGEQAMFQLCARGAVTEIRCGQFRADLARTAAALRAIPQERIGILAGNSYTWIVTALSAFLCGKQLILLDVNLSDRDLLQLLDYSDTQALITADELAGMLDFLPGGMPVYGFRDLESLRGDPAWRDETQRATLMCFTSGTSKSAKGVVIRADSVLREAHLVGADMPGRAGERFFLPIPLHHIYAFTCVFYILRHGGTICLGQSPKRFKEELETLDPHVAYLVPSMLHHMMDRGLTAPSLYCACTGGSACPPAVAQEAIRRGLRYYNMYGSSETLGYIAKGLPDQTDGLLCPAPGIRFFADGNGELCIELPIHMEYYYKKDDDTAEVLSGNILRTGDHAEVDARGCARIKGRLRDTIVLENGEKVHAEDKDHDLLELPHVQEAAVFGGPEGLCAVIVPDSAANWEQICRALDRYNAGFASFHRIQKYWMRLEGLPRTATGKLRRFLLETEYGKKGD